MTEILLIALTTLALSLAIAYAFMTRSKTAAGITLGLLPIVLMETLAQRSLNSSVQQCLDQLCTSAGLPPGCGLVELGCNEWIGLGYALFWLAGIIDFALFILGVIIIAVVISRKKRSSPSSQIPPP